jgi:hypothetical protein
VFELAPLFGATPIIPLEPNVEVEILPNLYLIVSHGWDGHIDEAKAADDLQSFNEKNYGRNPFCLISTSSATTPDDEEIAMILGAPPEIGDGRYGKDRMRQEHSRYVSWESYLVA